MKRKLWVLFIMSEDNAEPTADVVRPFTQHVELLERVGIPARFDPTREEVVDAWTSRSSTRR